MVRPVTCPGTARTPSGFLPSTGAREPDVDLALDVAPFLGRAQGGEQVVEGGGIARGELEPGEEIERLAQIARVVEPAGDRRQVTQADRDVGRTFLENLPPFLLRQRPPRGVFANRNQCRAGRIRAPACRG